MATDFRSGKDFPRRGRDVIGGYNWLVRVFDKARATKNGTIHDYIYPCPIDRAVFEIWGVTSAEFDAALDANQTDEQILAWLEARVTPAQRDKANAYVLNERKHNLDKQDLEEGVVAA
jgi:hypothetical protein